MISLQNKGSITQSLMFIFIFIFITPHFHSPSRSIWVSQISSPPYRVTYVVSVANLVTWSKNALLSPAAFFSTLSLR